MLTQSPTRVRFALVGIFAVLALGFALPTARSQIGRPPGFPPGGIGGVPGGGITGIPGGGGITGVPGGGITGMPGRPGGITGVPGGITGLPSMPARPPSLPAPNFGRTERVWSCSGCNRELGRGLAPPPIHTCPGCGARLVGIEFAPPGGMPSRPPAGTPATPPAGGGSLPGTATPPGGFELPTNPALGGGDAFPVATPIPDAGTTDADPGPAPSPAPSVQPAPSSDSPSDSGGSKDASSGKGRVLKVIGFVVGTGVFLAVVGMLIAVTRNAGGSRPVKRTRRPRRDDDDDD